MPPRARKHSAERSPRARKTKNESQII